MKYLALKLHKRLSDKYDCRKDFFPLKKSHYSANNKLVVLVGGGQ